MKLYDAKKLAQDLKLALVKDEICLFLQPKVNLKNEKVMGYEALARWTHPDYGIVDPDIWIGIAEAKGLMQPFTYKIITKALLLLKDWQARGWNYSIAINVPLSVFTAKTMAFIKDSLQEIKVDPRLLILEITESLPATHLSKLNATIQQIRQLGVKVSLDDFGTGYSTMSYLLELSVDELKIDRSFIHKATESAAAQALTKALVDMGQVLGMAVVCEGIETQEHLKMAQELGIDMGQGYYTGRPLPLAKQPLLSPVFNA